VQLESTIKAIPGVLGCVVLENPNGTPAEVQAFTRAGADRRSIERSIVDEARADGADDDFSQVFVFELDAESQFGDVESLERAAELAEQEARSRGPLGVLHALGTLHSLAESAPEPSAGGGERPPLHRVILSSSTVATEAHVTLGLGDDQVVGRAAGQRSPHGMNVVAEATLQAATQIVAGTGFTLLGTSFVDVLDREAVLVLVEETGGAAMLGSALVRDAPASEATVRATLDAINRRLTSRP
jgi:hypothetical protein